MEDINMILSGLNMFIYSSKLQFPFLRPFYYWRSPMPLKERNFLSQPTLMFLVYL